MLGTKSDAEPLMSPDSDQASQRITLQLERRILHVSSLESIVIECGGQEEQCPVALNGDDT